MEENSKKYNHLRSLKVIEGDKSQWVDLISDCFYEIRSHDNVTACAYVFDSDMAELFAIAPEMHDALEEALWVLDKVRNLKAQSCRDRILRLLEKPLSEASVSFSMLPAPKALSYGELNKRGVVAHSTPTHIEIIYDRFRYICKKKSENAEWRIVDAEPACVRDAARDLYDSLQRLLNEFVRHFPDDNTYPVHNAIASLSNAHGKEDQS